MTEKSSYRIVVVRPEPGASRTAAAVRAAGFTVGVMPLFAVVPLPWTPPDPADVDALLLTSANALRHGGAGLAALTTLPVLAVGQATAAAARSAGFIVALTGDSDAAALVDQAAAAGFLRLLHLAGRDHVKLGDVRAIAVYASEALPPPTDAADRLREAIVLIHSARAARAVARLVGERHRTAIAAISPAALAAAGDGWRAVAAAAVPTDAALLAAAAALGD